MRHGMNTKRPAADGASQNGRLNLDWSTAVIAGLAKPPVCATWSSRPAPARRR